MKISEVLAGDDMLPDNVKKFISKSDNPDRLKAALLKSMKRKTNNPAPSEKTRKNSFIDTFGNMGTDGGEQGRMMDPSITN